MKQEKARYLWRVVCNARCAEVTAADRLEAILAAARLWDLPWTGIARDCDCLRLRKAAQK